MYRKIIAVFMACMVVATTLVFPVFATDYQSTYNFWNWAYDNSWFLGKVIIGSADNVCPMSEDTLHHSTNHHAGGLVDGVRQYTCICDTCGQTFSAVATDLANSYDDGSSGFSRVDSSGRYYVDGKWILHFVDTVGANYGLSLESDRSAFVQVSIKNAEVQPYHRLYYTFTAPADCTLYCVGEFSFQNIGSADFEEAFNGFYVTKPYLTGQGAGSPVENTRYWGVSAGMPYQLETKYVYSPKGISGNVVYKLPELYFDLGPDDSFTTRLPVNIGGSVQYTDDNSYNEIYDAEFMDFSTNTYHNPVTDYSTKVDNWTYDYSNREFVGYTENGEVKIVYGNEYMSVTENGNIYNYYYSDGGNGSGSGNGSGDGSGGDGLLGKLGELLGTLLGGLIELITGVLNRILDSLITLAEMTIEKLGRIVNLFGSFGDALRTLWSWLPADVIEVLVAGVTVIVFCAVIKLFV